MSPAAPSKAWWFRRPRAPLAGFLGARGGRFSTFFALGMGFVLGFGNARIDSTWWARSLGVVVAAASVIGMAMVAAYLARPVSTDVTVATADAWSETLARTGQVEIGISKGKAVIRFSIGLAMVMLGAVGIVIGTVYLVVLGVALVLLMFVLVLLPLLEYATDQGPALRVDSHGIRIARWIPVEIPWSEVRGVGRSTGSSPSSTRAVLSKRAT